MGIKKSFWRKLFRGVQTASEVATVIKDVTSDGTPVNQQESGEQSNR